MSYKYSHMISLSVAILNVKLPWISNSNQSLIQEFRTLAP